ncbi:MAG: penicillin-binding transpeptidase domain-containing protein, partial [Veillonella sp.]|nr:penicillin-binding transpeptidase domain-containing protein [Veillonella sp.]
GMSKIIKLAKEMGITTLTDQDNNLSTALGGLTHGVIPLEMVQAYGVLANGGVKVQPTAIIKIVDRNGQVVEENSIQEKRVVEEKDAAIITDMLESVINGGTGGNAAIGRPAAGKTGTSDFSVPASAQSAVSEGYYNPVKAQPKKEAAKDEKADKKDDKDKSKDEAVKDDSGSKDDATEQKSNSSKSKKSSKKDR